jgi:hypothetical protein
MPQTIDVRKLPLAGRVAVEKVKKACRIGKPVPPALAMAAVKAKAAAKAGKGGISPGTERWPVKTGTDGDVQTS